MDTRLVYLLFNALALAVLVVVIFIFLKNFKKKTQTKAFELAACEQRKDGFYETISDLTAFYSVPQTLNFITQGLLKLGFPQVLIFVLNKKNRSLDLKIAKGFNEDIDDNGTKIPLVKNGGLISRALFENKFFSSSNLKNQPLPNLETNPAKFPLASFMLAPIARKGDDHCWELFHCANTDCPAYEDEKSYCWTQADTLCQSHLKEVFNPAIFNEPEKKLDACLTCERFAPLGVILVARPENSPFSLDDQKLFRALAYQTGVKLERAFLLTHLEEQRRELTRRMYELSILKELGERIGYSLNIPRTADIIINSLKKIIDYSTASYLLIDQSQAKLLFKCQIEEPISRVFVDEVKKITQAGLSALLNQDLSQKPLEESLAGTVLSENSVTPVRSFFNIPLTLGEKVAGLLNVASTRPGLYREEEMTILYKITSQASNAVTRLSSVLETEQEKLNSMVTSMADGVLMLDNENRIYVLNPKVKKMLGLEKSPISIFDIFNSLSGKLDFRTKLEESVKLDRLVITDEVFLNNHFLRILFSPVKNKAGQVLGAVIIFHDITHDKELEKMREDFTSMMVHDLRSPLNGIRLMSELMQKRGGAPSEMQKSAGLIHEATSSLLELVNDLLDVAKIEAGKFDINKQLDNLVELIYNQIDFFKVLAQDKNINLTAQIARNLSPFKFDSREIKQVLSNLISNALKFTDPGGNVIIQALPFNPREDVEKKALQAGINWFLSKENKNLKDWKKPGLICAVTDTGPGIAPDQIPQLFNKFEQIKSKKMQKSKIKGTGLGLVIAKGIIEAHGGVVSVESKVDKGSTFFFILPVE